MRRRVDGHGFFRRWGLILPAALAPAIEALVLGLFGPVGAIPLAPQVSAPTPLGLFHDLRWISVYHNGWVTLALEILGVLILRSLWVAWVVQRSWPDDEPPPMGRSALRSVVFLVVTAFLLIPFVVLLFGLALTHLSFLFFAALPPVLALALSLNGGAASQAMGRWWRWRPTWAGVAWLAASFVWLTLGGAAMRVVPLPAAVAIAAVLGIANARAWIGVVQSIARRKEPLRIRRPLLVPVAVATVFAVFVGGSAIGFAVTTNDPETPGSSPAESTVPGERPVLVAGGLYSRLSHEPPIPLPQGFVGWRYSYRGSDALGRPLDYGPADTTASVMVSATRMARQVERLAETYRQPVTILAESAGALVARTYLTELPPPPGTVDRLVSLEMHPGGASVYLPARGSEGWGVGTGWVLRGLAVVIGEMAPFDATVDRPLMRDLVDCGSTLRRVTSGRLTGGVEEVSIEALADWVDRPFVRPAGVDVQVVNAPHSGLLSRTSVQAVISDYLSAGTFEPRDGPHMTRFIAAVSSPWLSPSLERDLFPTGACTI